MDWAHGSGGRSLFDLVRGAMLVTDGCIDDDGSGRVGAHHTDHTINNIAVTSDGL